jgi:hypothetical protein
MYTVQIVIARNEVTKQSSVPRNWTVWLDCFSPYA